MSISETFEEMFRKRFGRAPTQEELTVLVDQSVASYNQTGGITAHTVNLGKPHRKLGSPEGEALKGQILSELDREGPWSVAGISGDMESCQYAEEIREFMDAEGFKMKENGFVAIMPIKAVIGLEVWPPRPEPEGLGDDHWRLIVGAKP